MVIGKLISATIVPSLSLGAKTQNFLTAMPYEPKRDPLDPCPVEEVVRLFSGKWKARILFLLSLQPCRFAELRRGLPGVTQQVLSAQLQAMVADGLVHGERKESPAGGYSTYSLTAFGESLLPLLRDISAVGLEILRGRGLDWTPPARPAGRTLE